MPTPDDLPRPRDQVRSVSRALRVLEVVSASPAPLTVKAVARRVGLNVSTTYHLVRTLAFEGYLVRAPDGRYLPGPEVARRFHDVRLALGRPPKAATVLSSLAATTGHSAYLSRLVEGRVLVIEVAEGPASPYLEDLEVGLDASGHASALGKALLAALPHDQRRSYLREQGLPRFTSRTPTDLAALEHELSLLSPGSVVTEHGQFRNGVSCAATLVRPDGCEGGRWALGVSCRGEEVPVAVVGELLLATDALSRADDVPTRRPGAR